MVVADNVVKVSGSRKVKQHNMEIAPVERVLLIDQIIEIIKGQIAEGRVKPGDTIPSERILSEMFKVSRTSVRQALKALAVLGVLEIRPGATTVLSKDVSNLLINPLKFMSVLYNVEIPEIFETRKTIEVELSKKAAVHATDEEIELMRGCLKKAENNLHNQSVFLYSEKDFHECIFDASRNRILAAMIRSLNTLLISTRKETIRTFPDLKVSFDEHMKIFEAIVQHDPEAAGDAMMEHLTDIENRLNTLDLANLKKKANS
jgi:GntR family transcriptional repressor for pyruvate dehydrogenase complex